MLNNLVPVLLAIAFGIVSKSSAIKPPKEFALCHRSDPEFGKCLAQAAQSSIRAIAPGSKDLGLQPLDHLKIPSIVIEGNGGRVDLTQNYNDCVLAGASDANFLYAEAAFEKDKCYLRFRILADVVTMTCQYVFKGKLLMFQLNGHGHSNITMTNMGKWRNLTCDFYEKRGEEYLNITDWADELTAEKIFYDFDNLVDGNSELSAQVLQVINDNAMEMFENLKADYEKSYGTIYKHLANKVFGKIPWKEIFPE